MHYVTPEYSFPYALIKPKSKMRNNAALVPSLDYIHNLKLVCFYIRIQNITVSTFI